MSSIVGRKEAARQSKRDGQDAGRDDEVHPPSDALPPGLPRGGERQADARIDESQRDRRVVTRLDRLDP